MTESLPDTIVGILDDFQVPVPTGVVRVVASERRGEPVTSEALARVAGGQRVSFERTGKAPRLCDVIDKNLINVRPRIWARGDWRLARRIITLDVMDAWRAGLAVALCNEVLKRSPSEELGRLALEAVGRVVGRVAAFLPGNEDEWVQLRSRVAATLPGLGLASHTAEQGRAERRLLQHRPSPPAEALYFGLREDFELARDPEDPELIELPSPDDDGQSFDRIAWRRLGGDERELRVLLSYLQGYSAVMDELGRAPSDSEFAQRWRFSLASVKEDKALFRKAFPEEADGPERLLRLLERALPQHGAMARLMGARVIDRSPASVDPLAAPGFATGQRWRSPDRKEVVSIIEPDEQGRYIGVWHDEETGATTISAGTREDLKGWKLDLPTGVWRVRFDLQTASTLLQHELSNAGFWLNNLRRPGDPRPGHPALPAATVEVLVAALDEDEARQAVIAKADVMGAVDPGSITVEPT